MTEGTQAVIPDQLFQLKLPRLWVSQSLKCLWLGPMQGPPIHVISGKLLVSWRLWTSHITLPSIWLTASRFHGFLDQTRKQLPGDSLLCDSRHSDSLLPGNSLLPGLSHGPIILHHSDSQKETNYPTWLSLSLHWREISVCSGYVATKAHLDYH